MSAGNPTPNAIGERETTALAARPALIIRTLLCVHLAMMGLFFVILVWANWGQSNDGRLTQAFAASYTIAVIAMISGLHMSGEGPTRATLRRVLIMAPCGMAAGTLLMSNVLALEELASFRWHANPLTFSKTFGPMILVGAVLGAGLGPVFRRVRFSRLLFRGWLLLLVYAVLVAVFTSVSTGICWSRPGLMAGCVSMFAALGAAAALCWTFGFGLALALFRDPALNAQNGEGLAATSPQSRFAR